MQSKSVAIVTDWIYGGGSELVVEELHKQFPDAPIYTSYCSDEWRDRLHNKVVTGYLQKPLFVTLRKFLPLLRQWWFARIDLSSFDLIVSVTGNGEAKFAKANDNATHISYCNTPVHYYWRHYEQYLKNPGFKPEWLARLGLKVFVRPLRKRDFKAAQKVDVFIANSHHIQSDIKQYYARESTVVYPPVNIKRFTKVATPQRRAGFVTHGRLVPAKRVDLLIEACNKRNAMLTVIGKGPDLERLKQLAGPTITFKGFVSDEDLPAVLASHQAFLFASFEDFGIAPVEAMATGLPVIAYKAGGALDYVDNSTGLLFDKQDVVSLTETLQKFDGKLFDSSVIRKKSEQFSQEAFQKAFRKVLND